MTQLAAAMAHRSRPAEGITRGSASRFDASPRVGRLSQLAATANRSGDVTGLGARLRAGLESLSGFDLGGVRVHFNSARPAALHAAAYTQGTDVHLAPGHAHHLAHEGWHVVQQMEGRVRPTIRVAGSPVNDDAALEREADVWGARAARWSGS